MADYAYAQKQKEKSVITDDMKLFTEDIWTNVEKVIDEKAIEVNPFTAFVQEKVYKTENITDRVKFDDILKAANEYDNNANSHFSIAKQRDLLKKAMTSFGDMRKLKIPMTGGRTLNGWSKICLRN